MGVGTPAWEDLHQVLSQATKQPWREIQATFSPMIDNQSGASAGRRSIQMLEHMISKNI